MRTSHEIVLMDTFLMVVDCIGGFKKGHITYNIMFAVVVMF